MPSKRFNHGNSSEHRNGDQTISGEWKHENQWEIGFYTKCLIVAKLFNPFFALSTFLSLFFLLFSLCDCFFPDFLSLSPSVAPFFSFRFTVYGCLSIRICPSTLLPLSKVFLLFDCPQSLSLPLPSFLLSPSLSPRHTVSSLHRSKRI